MDYRGNKNYTEQDHLSDVFTMTAKIQCHGRHLEGGRGSSMADGALPYDIAHLAGGGVTA